MKQRKSATSRSPRLGDVPMGVGTPQLNPEIQAKIGQQLCRIYDEMINQGVPNRFRDLLDRLEHPSKRGRDQQ